MASGAVTSARRILVVLLVIGLAVAAYAGYWLLTSERV
jgi:hypothetical protein